MKAIAVSPGYAHGKVFILQDEVNWNNISLQTNDVPGEVSKFNLAIQKSAAEIKELILQFKGSNQKDQADIFEAHALMIEDPEVLEQTIGLVQTQAMSAAWAYKKTSDGYAQMLAALDDEYLKERAADVRDIAGRVLKHLLGKAQENLKELPLGSILVARDITPSQISLLDAKQVGVSVMGIITEMGGKTSHTAIIARALEIPSVAGVQGILEQVENGTEILFDGVTGQIKIQPTLEDIKDFNFKKNQFEAQKKDLLSFRRLKSETHDKRTVRLAANIGGVSDVFSLISNDAEAVGLYRTEFVFLDRNRVPSQEEQFQIYREVFEKLGERHCIIRTLDIGGDKQLEGLSMDQELNPFLGLRGVRLCLREQNIFKDQLKAILRAAVGHSVGIMVPMISNIEEILETKKIIKECQSELRACGQKFSEGFKFGVMIEVPSAAMIVDFISRHVDFISIGTNDLTQYICAVDRLNDKVEKLYNPYNPGFLRTMNSILSAARKNNLHVGICGSLAHEEFLVPLFIGMGVDELSMTSQHILQTRKLVRSLNYQDCQKLVEEVLQLETSAEIKAKIQAGKSKEKA
ncbi:MAG TPA: phosphoenolpyruvate--protein phosphotransferase [Pseudobdellovibrionaceae bacterium]|jgi:phosphotransferase system enzyme I (PtsI)